MDKEEILNRLKTLEEKLNLEAKKKRLEELKKESEDPVLWQDHQRATQIMKELADLQKEIETMEMAALFIEEGELAEAEKLLSQAEKELYFSGPYDRGGAMVTIQAGQGGTEAMDWAGMLARMYQRFFEKKGWRYEILDRSLGEEAGIKSLTMRVEGKNVYGMLKHEQGAHRLVRQSPFNADKLRQTSFARVEVFPLLPKEDFEINEDEIELRPFGPAVMAGKMLIRLPRRCVYAINRQALWFPASHNVINPKIGNWQWRCCGKSFGRLRRKSERKKKPKFAANIMLLAGASKFGLMFCTLIK